MHVHVVHMHVHVQSHYTAHVHLAKTSSGVGCSVTTLWLVLIRRDSTENVVP